MRRDKNGKMTLICVIAFFIFLIVAAWIENMEFEEYDGERFRNRICYCFNKSVTYSVFPIFGYAKEEMWEAETNVSEAFFCNEIPIFTLLKENIELLETTEDEETLFLLTQMNAEEIEKITENTEGIFYTSEF